MSDKVASSYSYLNICIYNFSSLVKTFRSISTSTLNFTLINDLNGGDSVRLIVRTLHSTALALRYVFASIYTSSFSI
jgi:hypothetical protein